MRGHVRKRGNTWTAEVLAKRDQLAEAGEVPPLIGTDEREEE